MIDETSMRDERGMMRYLTARVSRSQLLKAAAAGAALAAVPSVAGA